MKRWKKAVLTGLGLACLFPVGLYTYMQGLGDIRTEDARARGESAASQEAGRAVLARAVEALGGAERWSRLRERTVGVTFRHTWHHRLLEAFYMPLEFSGQELSFLLRPGYLDTRLTFLDGGWKGKSWGTFEGRTYEVGADGTLAWGGDETVAFHLLGYRFFFFLVFHLSEAELITHAGTRDLHGRTYDLVYVTWDDWEPQRAVDQYLVWIDRETSTVDYVQSTVREMYARSIVSCSLGDYRAALGVRLPFSLKVLEDIDDLGAGMHHMEVLEARVVEDEDAMLLRAPGGGGVE